jgi:hypothetical protein
LGAGTACLLLQKNQMSPLWWKASSWMDPWKCFDRLNSKQPWWQCRSLLWLLWKESRWFDCRNGVKFAHKCF